MMRVPEPTPLRTAIVGTIAFIVVTSCAPEARATEVTGASLIVGSYHFQRDREYREINPGIALQFDRRIVAGIYRNSFDRTTIFVGVTEHLGRVGRVDFSAMAALGTGYRFPIIGGLHAKHADIPVGLTLTPSAIGFSIDY